MKRKDLAVSLPGIDMAATGRNIEFLRKAAGYSVRDLQTILGFASPQAIYKWQRGETLPSLDSMTVLARFLGRPIEDFIIYRSKEGL